MTQNYICKDSEEKPEHKKDAKKFIQKTDTV
jgi:hypothetical protein